MPLFPGVYGIFGHGNVTCLGHALREAARRTAHVARAERAGHGARRRRLRQGDAPPPDHGGHLVDRAGGDEHDHGRRRRPWPTACRSCSSPATRSRAACPTRCCSRSSTSATRRSPVNDGFRPVTRYWDRITRPEQLLHSLPQAVATMLDPATCGPAFLALPQDVQAEAYDYPEEFFAPRCTTSPGPAPTSASSPRAAAICAARAPADHRRRRRALLGAEADSRRSPSATASRWSRRGRQGVPARPRTRSTPVRSASPAPARANTLAARGRRGARRGHAPAGLHHRLVDGVRRRVDAFVGINAAGFDAIKHRRSPWSATPASARAS